MNRRRRRVTLAFRASSTANPASAAALTTVIAAVISDVTRSPASTTCQAFGGHWSMQSVSGPAAGSVDENITASVHSTADVPANHTSSRRSADAIRWSYGKHSAIVASTGTNT